MKKKYFNRILLVMCACVIAYAFLQIGRAHV